MELTEEEKELFRIHDEKLEYGPSAHIEKVLLSDIYGTLESYDNLFITLGYLKRLILEVSKKRNYDIDENVAFDIDDLMGRIINVDEELVGFKTSYYGDPDAMNKYIDDTIKNMDWDDTESFRKRLFCTNDCFRLFFIDYVQESIRIADDLDNELEFDSDTDDVFSNSINDESSVSIEPISEEDSDWNDWGDWEEFDPEEVGEDFLNYKEEEKPPITEERLKNLLMFINSLAVLLKYRDLGNSIISKLSDIVVNKKLEYFYSDEEFVEKFTAIMAHDERDSMFYFHGTQCLEDAESILDQGLGMTRENINSTAYSEFTKDELILYSRGFCGEIGRDAVVIIDNPREIDGSLLKIVRELDDSSSIKFCPSGLQGLNQGAHYIVDPQYIVGYVDKLNRKIVFNPKYKNYDRFSIYTNNEEKSL